MSRPEPCRDLGCHVNRINVTTEFDSASSFVRTGRDDPRQWHTSIDVHCQLIVSGRERYRSRHNFDEHVIVNLLKYLKFKHDDEQFDLHVNDGSLHHDNFKHYNVIHDYNDHASDHNDQHDDDHNIDNDFDHNDHRRGIFDHDHHAIVAVVCAVS